MASTNGPLPRCRTVDSYVVGLFLRLVPSHITHQQGAFAPRWSAVRWAGRARAACIACGLLVAVVALTGSAGAQQTTTTVQASPTADATRVALEKDKLAGEVERLQQQNSVSFTRWIADNGADLAAAAVALIVGAIGFLKYFNDQKDARQKAADERDRWHSELQATRDELQSETQRWRDDFEAGRRQRDDERFQAAVAGLGSSELGTAVGAAVVLRSFLGSDYERFAPSVFHLAVGHLRLLPGDNAEAQRVRPVRRALARVLAEAYPQARGPVDQSPTSMSIEEVERERDRHVDLDADLVHLQRTYLRGADFRYARLPYARFERAYLRESHFDGGVVAFAYFDDADLREATLSRVDAKQASFLNADLTGADLSGSRLDGAEMTGCILDGADLRRASFKNVPLEAAASMKGAKLWDAEGLTPEQREKCEANGAIVVSPDVVPST